MTDWGTEDIVTLQLEGTDQWREARVVPRDVAVPGISEALDLGEESLAGRVALLSALEELKRRGLVEQRKKSVRGMDGRRNAYFLTDRGREHVAKLREQLTDETIVVRNGTDEKVELGEVGEYLREPALPRALSRLTEAGVLYLDEDVGESFVDREAERALLESTMERVADGEAHAALVIGEAGIGKTTLVTEEFSSRAREAGFRLLLGSCRRDASEPYEPFTGAFSELDLEEDPFDREGVDPGDAESFEAERTAMFESVVDVLEEAAQRSPLLVVIDDLHLADDPTIAMFEHVADRVEGPVFLVGTCRPGEAESGTAMGDLLDGWERGDRRLVLDLDRFEREDTRRLVQWVTDHRAIPESFVDLVYERTGGNPLFVKESVARMCEDGTVDPEHDVFPDDPGDVPLFDRIEEAVERRLTVLDEGTRLVLEIGGLIGETIEFDVLSAALDLEEAAVREHVDVLVDSHVWERDGDHLRFVSGLVRETVVDRIGAHRGRDLHERIAEAILEAGESDRDHHATVAHHYHEAGHYESAVEQYLEAGDRATDVYANEVALSNYRSVLDLLRDRLDRPEDGDTVVEVLTKIAEVNYLLGEYEEADRFYQYVTDRIDDDEELRRIYRIRADMASTQFDFERELELAETGLEVAGIDDTLETCLLLGRKGAGHDHNEQLAEAEEAYKQCLAVAKRIDDPEGLAAAYLNLGALDLRLREVNEDTIETLEEAVEAAERADSDRTLARALNNLAMCQSELGRDEEAVETYHRVLAVHEAIGDRMALCDSLRNLAMIHQQHGSYETALETYHRALDTARQIQKHNTIASVTASISGVHHGLGDLDLAMEYMRESLESARTVGDTDLEVRSAAYLVDLHLDRGELEAADRLAEDITERLSEVRSPLSLSLGHWVQGDLARERGDLTAAREHYEDGMAVDGEGMTTHPIVWNANGLVEVAADRGDVELATEAAERSMEAAAATDDEMTVAEATVYEGIARRVAGDYDEAIDAIESGLETYRDGESTFKGGELHALVNLAAVYRDLGDRQQTQQYAKEARSIAEDTGIGRYDDRIEELLTANSATE
jgi:predicted ATPase